LLYAIYALRAFAIFFNSSSGILSIYSGFVFPYSLCDTELLGLSCTAAEASCLGLNVCSPPINGPPAEVIVAGIATDSKPLRVIPGEKNPLKEAVAFI
jgi:hypothetical protein